MEFAEARARLAPLLDPEHVAQLLLVQPEPLGDRVVLPGRRSIDAQSEVRLPPLVVPQLLLVIRVPFRFVVHAYVPAVELRHALRVVVDALVDRERRGEHVRARLLLGVGGGLLVEGVFEEGFVDGLRFDPEAHRRDVGAVAGELEREDVGDVGGAPEGVVEGDVEVAVGRQPRGLLLAAPLRTSGEAVL